MAVQVKDIARDVVALCGTDFGYELFSKWTSRRYQMLCAQGQFRHLRKVAQLYLPAPITGGSFTVTLGSPIILADSTATAAMQAVIGAPDAIVGQWFRLLQGSVWYRIAQVIPGSTWNLVLETPYASDNTGAGIFSNNTTQANLNYYIVPRFVELAPDARQIGTMVIDAMYRPLARMSEDELNLMYNARFLVAYPPWCYAIVGSALGDTNQPKVAEFYPWPQASTTIHYTYWANPPALKIDDYIPPTIDADILVAGVSADAWAQEAATMLRTGKVAEAQAARNWSREENQRFQSMIGRAMRNDRGSEDLKFILRRRRAIPPDFDPIMTAYENWYASGGNQ